MPEHNVEFFQKILDSIQHPFYVIDAGNYKIKFANKACGFGDLNENSTCHLLTHKSVIPCKGQHICPLMEVKKTKQAVKTEHIHYDKDGNPRNMEVHGDPVFDNDGNIIMMIEYAYDVTERKKAEKKLQDTYRELEQTQSQLIQAEKMDAIGKMASGIAHEVKNPLGIIIQGVNYLESKISPEQKDVAEVLEMMKNNVKRADDIIRGLLDFSKKEEMHVDPEDINAILESSLFLIQHNIKPGAIEIVRDLKDGLPKILVHKGRIEQVFINLFLNAIQAMPQGGKLFIRSYLTRLDKLANGIGRRRSDYFRPGEEAVVVEIEDTGIGIPQENLLKVFEPFYTTKDSQAGVGLGLSVTKNIIDLHKGLIEVQSEQGKGTKVLVILKAL